MKPFKTTLNGKELLVSPILQGYTIYDRQSSMISYIAVNEANLFIQFNNRTSFLYRDVPVDLIKSAVTAVSIGKWWHSHIKGKIEGEAVESHCIQADTGDQEDDDLSMFSSVEDWDG